MGRTKAFALIIGIDYLKYEKMKLGGCINDANEIYELLREKCNFKKEYSKAD